MFSGLDVQTKHMLEGNILLVICCIFYLAWWIIAFHPSHGIRGFKTGWLLIPALIFGALAVIQVLRGCLGDDVPSIIPKPAIAIGGIVVYVALLLVSYLLLHRQVTTELLLIVGWVVLMFLELCALQGMGYYSTTTLVILLIATVVLAAISIVCYLLYYDLNPVVGYIDGMIPLLIVAIMMVVVTGSVVIR